MPEFNVVVAFDGTGRLKVRADTIEQAREDAAQMDPDDIEWDMHTITVLHIDGEE